MKQRKPLVLHAPKQRNHIALLAWRRSAGRHSGPTRSAANRKAVREDASLS